MMSGNVLTVWRRQQPEQHLIMEDTRVVCPECRAAGRGAGEHPAAANGANGAINYRRMIS